MTQLVEQRERNWAVYILFALAVIAGILALVDAARYMGWLAFSVNVPSLGEIKFVLPEANWFAAILSAIVGIIWFVVAGWLWNLEPSGWLFVAVISVFNLIVLFLAVLGQTTFEQVVLPVVVNALALILALLPGTKAAFTPQPTAEAVAAADAAKARAATAATAARAGMAAPAATAATAAAEPRPAPQVQDLTRIEGIGPKISAALADAGITSYADLEAAQVDRLRQILADASLSADPSTWPEQASLAAASRWADLQALQDELVGGREA